MDRYSSRGFSEQKRPPERKIKVDPKKIMRSVLWVMVIFFVISLVTGSFYTVPAGQRAVVMTFGKPSMDARGEGLHFKMPLIQSRELMDVQTQRYDAEAHAASTDLQMVSTRVAINYRPEAASTPRIYRDYGLEYEERIIDPVVQETIKACTAQYRAEDLITDREKVKSQIDVMLTARLRERHIIVEGVSITDFNFSLNFNEAIEAKVTAEQNALAAKNKLEQVKYEAEQAVAKAKGEAEAIRIQAEAIQAQGGKDYVQLKAVEKWDGKMPIYTGGALPFIDLSKRE